MISTAKTTVYFKTCIQPCVLKYAMSYFNFCSETNDLKKLILVIIDMYKLLLVILAVLRINSDNRNNCGIIFNLKGAEMFH